MIANTAGHFTRLMRELVHEGGERRFDNVTLDQARSDRTRR